MSPNQGQLPLLEMLRRDGVVSGDARLQPLSGGISSDIFLIVDAGPPRVVKRALQQLRVVDEWLANVSRNDFEQRYLRYVSHFMSDSVPAVLASGSGYFIMPYFDSAYVTWKSCLLEGVARPEDAQKAGRFLGCVHEHSSNDPEAARQFDSNENFRQLRVDPYLLAVARRHPEVDDIIRTEADRLANWRECLVHGDYSPKNMLLNGHHLVVLDCEVAWYGDPAFDLAFLISHLLLKSLFHAPRKVGLHQLVQAFVARYLHSRRLSRGEQETLLARTSSLACILLLARVDGKSLVEYLDEARQEVVRSFTIQALQTGPSNDPRELCEQWFRHLETAIDPL
jgi:aminoglycoside phosphotransferase (APT) family kinase protein